MHPIIVGIDPGTTCAFAVLSIDFTLLNVKSKKNYAMGQLIKDIYEQGHPIIVGTDKKNVPSFIKEFSQKTGANVFTPKYDTKKSEKKTLVKSYDFSNKVKNAHETDALASAIYAYKYHEAIIKKIKRFTVQHHKKDLFDMIVQKVIQEKKSIKATVAEVEFVPQKKIVSKRRKSITPPIQLSKDHKHLLLLKKQTTKLKQKIKYLLEQNQKLTKKNISEEIKKIISFKEKKAIILDQKVKQLKKKIKQKDNQIKQLNEFISQSQGKILVKKRPSNIKKGDVLYVDDISKIHDLKDHIIIYNKGTNKKLKCIQIQKDTINMIETTHFILVTKSQLNKQAQKPIKDKSFLKNIVDDYKRERILE